MWDIIAMWRKPKMVALAALIAVLYAAVLIPLGGFQAFNGSVDLGRVGIVVPLVSSVLFGPAAAWGAAFGNVIRDLAGSQLNAASVHGFVANFLVGYMPYLLWTALKANSPRVKMPRKIATFLAASVLACILCAATIGIGVYLLYSVPFPRIFSAVFLTNSFWAVAVGPFLFVATYGCVRKRQMLHEEKEILPEILKT